MRGSLGGPARHGRDAADRGAGEGPGRSRGGKAHSGPVRGPGCARPLLCAAETPPPGVKAGRNGECAEQSPAPAALLPCARLAWPCLLQRGRGQRRVRGETRQSHCLELGERAAVVLTKSEPCACVWGFGFLLFAWGGEDWLFFGVFFRG